MKTIKDKYSGMSFAEAAKKIEKKYKDRKFNSLQDKAYKEEMKMLMRMQEEAKGKQEIDKLQQSVGAQLEDFANKNKMKEGGSFPDRYKKMGFSGVNKPKRTPGASKSHAVVVKDGGSYKLIRFGQQGVSGAGKNPKTDKQKARRKSFKARHAKNIAKGKTSAAYWANKVKWAEGGWIKEAADKMKEKGTEGAFTRSAKQAGMGVQAYATKVLNDPDASTTQKRRANFAKTMNKIGKKKLALSGYLEGAINDPNNPLNSIAQPANVPLGGFGNGTGPEDGKPKTNTPLNSLRSGNPLATTARYFGNMKKSVQENYIRPTLYDWENFTRNLLLTPKKENPQGFIDKALDFDNRITEPLLDKYHSFLRRLWLGDKENKGGDFGGGGAFGRWDDPEPKTREEKRIILTGPLVPNLPPRKPSETPQDINLPVEDLTGEINPNEIMEVPFLKTLAQKQLEKKRELDLEKGKVTPRETTEYKKGYNAYLPSYIGQGLSVLGNAAMIASADKNEPIFNPYESEVRRKMDSMGVDLDPARQSIQSSANAAINRISNMSRSAANLKSNLQNIYANVNSSVANVDMQQQQQLNNLRQYQASTIANLGANKQQALSIAQEANDRNKAARESGLSQLFAQIGDTGKFMTRMELNKRQNTMAAKILSDSFANVDLDPKIMEKISTGRFVDLTEDDMIKIKRNTTAKEFDDFQKYMKEQQAQNQ